MRRIPHIKARAITLAASFMFCALAACADPIAHHEFSFGDVNRQENKGIEILDYRYGNNKTIPTSPSADQLASGHVPQFTSVGTFDPPGDSLYVKWRVKSTGKVYQDTVDLKSRLPSNMNNKEIHFLIKDTKLYVYLIASEPHEVGKAYKRTCESLYPERLSNCGNYSY
ncbi:MAG TPA: hypothetical protein VFT64_05800 [Rickettsiales bacterium]|nr:hypothetical protein [Rickettsiales bacterium]